MSGLIKLTWALALVIILAAGCADTAEIPPAPQITYESMGKATYSPVLLNYAVDNPVEVTEIRSDRNSHWTYFQISGLKDKAVEAKINGEIKALFQQMLPYAMGEKRPPYRGIDAALSEDMIFSESYLNLSPQFNCNNVLSVHALVTGVYNLLPQQVHFSAVETLNFDLNTGQTFMVEDVFVNNVDALEIINAAIAEEIRSWSMEEDTGWHRDVAMVSPFKGIGHGQKFYLDNYGLNIVLDYNNPEFELGFNEAVITIPYKPDHGRIAITERFYDKDESIYIRDPFGKRFFIAPNPREFTRETRTVDGIKWNVVINCPQDVCSLVKDIADSHWQSDVRKVLNLSQVTYVDYNIHASYMGGYINVTCSLQVPMADQFYWQEKYSVCTPQGRILRLEDIFVEGYDFWSLIEPVHMRTAKEQGLSGDAARALMDELTFKLGPDQIAFLAVAENNKPVFFDIPYAEIGSSNFTIFAP